MVLEEGASSSMVIDEADEELVAKEPMFSVLIVDDDPVIRKVHEMLMKKGKMITHLAENGSQAVDLCLGEFFNLILIDKEMPVMDGVQATKDLRALGVTSMIVGIISRCSDEEREAFTEAGLDFCFEKPLTSNKIDILVEKLKEIN